MKAGEGPWEEPASPRDLDNPMLRVLNRSEQGVTIVRPEGVLDLATAPVLRDVLLKKAAEQPRALIVDLAELKVGGSSLLTVLAVVWGRLQALWSVPLMVVASEQEMANYPVPPPVPVYRTLDAAIAALDEPPVRLLAHRQLSASLNSAREARHFVAETLEGWPISLDELTKESAVITVSELAQNVVRHTPVAEMRIRLEWHAPWLHIAVADDDLNPAVLQERSGEGGYGLLLVARLSHTWGCSAHPAGGKVVWAVLNAQAEIQSP